MLVVLLVLVSSSLLLILLGGNAWSQTSARSAKWYAIASDSIGSNLAAVQNPGDIYTSSSG